MKYVMRTGEKTLQQTGSRSDRRPRHVSHLRTAARRLPRQRGAAEQQHRRHSPDGDGGSRIARAADAGRRRPAARRAAVAAEAAAAGRGGAAGIAGIDIQQLMGRGGNPQQQGRLQQLQDQLAQADQTQNVVVCAGVFPRHGDAVDGIAGDARGRRRTQRRGLPARRSCRRPKCRARWRSADGDSARHAITLMPLDQGNTPPVPGVDTDTTRVGADGTFTFRDVPPGQYRVMARGARARSERAERATAAADAAADAAVRAVPADRAAAAAQNPAGAVGIGRRERQRPGRQWRVDHVAGRHDAQRPHRV